MTPTDLTGLIRARLAAQIQALCPDALVMHWQNMPLPLPDAGKGFLKMEIRFDTSLDQPCLGPASSLAGALAMTAAMPAGSGVVVLDGLVELLRRELAHQTRHSMRFGALDTGHGYLRGLYHCMDLSLPFEGWA